MEPQEEPHISMSDLEELDPEALERLYIAIMTVQIKNLSLDIHCQNRPLGLEFKLRSKHIKTLFVKDRPLLYDIIHEFPLSYHSVMFDTLKIDIIEQTSIFGHSKIARCRIKLSELSSHTGQVNARFDLLPRTNLLKGKPTNFPVGSISVCFGFIPSNDLKESFYLETLSESSNVGDPWEFLEYFEQEQSQGSQFQRHNSVTTDSSVTAYSEADTITTKLSKVKGKFLSLRTSSGLKELSDFAAGFFKTGWPITKLELTKTILFMNNYFEHYYQQPRTNELVEDSKVLEELLKWAPFAMAAYGSFIVNWCGRGNGFFLDSLKPNGNKKLASQILKIQESDILAWEIGNGEMFKPNFFICKDSKADCLIISIRGTWSITETLTDLCGEYEPFMGGYAHRGFLRCAKWIQIHYFDQIIEWKSEFNLKKVVAVGHSLGGAIASILVMIMKNLNSEITFEAINFASPPCVSLDLADEYSNCIKTIINEYDIVPRISAGVLMDLKEVTISACSILKSKEAYKHKLEALDLIMKRVQRESKHPKVYLPGTVFYAFKSTRAQTKYLNDNVGPKPSPVGSVNFKESPHHLLDYKVPHYAVEIADRVNFGTLILRSFMVVHHFPDRYEKSLKKAIEWLDQFK